MRMGKRLYSLIMFLVVSVLGGLLAAGLAVPAAGMASEAGKAGVTSLKTLPTELETPPQSQRSRALTADGKVLAYFYDEYRIYKPLRQISNVMKQAQIAIEDHRFYQHGAIDLQGTLRALVSTTRGNTQGGSTLTQQYVRQVQIETALQRGDKEGAAKAQENTIARKIRELRFAIAVEQKYNKDQILERYLNIAYYGAGAYGVEAAAHRYFGISAKKLNLAQAAMLAGLVRNPVMTNPISHEAVAIERRNNVLDRMVELGLVTVQQASKAKAVKFDKSKVTENRKGCANSRFPFLCDYVERTLLNTPSLGADRDARKNTLYRGGLTIQTQIDPKTQRSAEKSISRYIDARDQAVSVITMVEPGTGLIVAMAQSRQKMGNKKGQTFFNYAVSNAMGGADGFQGGSTFKGFVIGAALEKGIPPTRSYNAPMVLNLGGQVFQSCDGPFRVGRWRVVGGTNSTINMYQGATRSVNTYFAQLERDVGICASVKMAKTLGLELAMGGDLVEKYHYIASFTLGAAEVTPLSMAEAYATYAARGIHCEPIIIKSVKSSEGKNLQVPSANCKQVIPKEIADGVNRILHGPINAGTARPAKVYGYDMAGKTGTVDSNKAIWTVAYTPELVGAAVLGIDRSNKKLRKYWAARPSSGIKGAYMKYSHRYLTGNSGQEAGGRILRPALSVALKNYPRTQFAAPGSDVLYGRRAPVPSCEGLGISECKDELKAAGFDSYVTRVYSNSPAGTFLGLSPSGLARAYSRIAIQISAGPAAPKTTKPSTTNPSSKPTNTNTSRPTTEPTSSKTKKKK